MFARGHGIGKRDPETRAFRAIAQFDGAVHFLFVGDWLAMTGPPMSQRKVHIHHRSPVALVVVLANKISNFNETEVCPDSSSSDSR